MAVRRSRIREARTAEEHRAAVVDRWHQIFKPMPTAVPEIPDQPRTIRVPGRRRHGGDFGHRSPFDDDDLE
jgi:hypothetical protein